MTAQEQPALERRLEMLEPAYETTSEAQIGRTLDQYGIPFFYQQARVVLEDTEYRIRHPDFTLPSHDGLIIEYAGGPSSSIDTTEHRHLLHLYADNGIPAIVLGPRDLTDTNWEQNLYQRILNYSRPIIDTNELSYDRYQPRDR